jgi:hypothetical protein
MAGNCHSNGNVELTGTDNNTFDLAYAWRTL